MLVDITKAYTAKYPDPIRFEAGAVIEIERGDLEFPGWYWCRTESGAEGWFHRSFLAACSGTTTSNQAYSARELTVVGGERGTLVHLLDGWAYVRIEGGAEGWLPQSHIHPVTPTRL
jgi:hypothetical protein